MLLRGFARPIEAELIAEIGAIVARAPLRHMVTPSGHSMSVAMTNCGRIGWVTDRSGYRYDSSDPETAKQAMDNIQEAKRLLAETRKAHLSEIRQLELDKVMDVFDRVIRDLARPSEASAFDNLAKTAYSADRDR